MRVWLTLALMLPTAAWSETWTVASKTFTESVILAEMARRTAPPGLTVIHRRDLGGSRVLFSAIERGDIDLYPDYTGTLTHELLQLKEPEDLRRALAARGLAMTDPLGFNNTYAIALRRPRAEALGLARISDLARHPDLVFGFSNEFMQRADGWPGLRRHYGLPHDDVRGLAHDLAYRGLQAGDIDVIDAYATDADIRYYDLSVLADDRGFFPTYEAVFVYRPALAQHAPE